MTILVKSETEVFCAARGNLGRFRPLGDSRRFFVYERNITMYTYITVLVRRNSFNKE